MAGRIIFELVFAQVWLLRRIIVLFRRNSPAPNLSLGIAISGSWLPNPISPCLLSLSPLACDHRLYSALVLNRRLRGPLHYDFLRS